MFDTFSIPEHNLPIVYLQDLFGLRSDGEEDKPSLSSLVLDSVPTAVIIPAVGLSQKSADSSEVSQASGAWGDSLPIHFQVSVFFGFGLRFVVTFLSLTQSLT